MPSGGKGKRDSACRTTATFAALVPGLVVVLPERPLDRAPGGGLGGHQWHDCGDHGTSA